MTVDEIRASILADLALYALVPDAEAICAAMSAGRFRLRRTQCGPGNIMSALGATDGAAMLDALEGVSKTPHPLARAIYWTLTIINRGDFDFGDPETRTQIAALAAAGVMSDASRDKLLALGQEPDPLPLEMVRWAILNDDGTQAI